MPELRKPEGVTCRFACKGCSIYEDRPQSCRSFECLWLRSDWMDDNLRPDFSGVMFEEFPDRNTVVATVDPQRPQIGQDPRLVAVIDRLIKQDRPVIIVSSGHPEPLTILPDGWTYEDAWRGIKAA